MASLMVIPYWVGIFLRIYLMADPSSPNTPTAPPSPSDLGHRVEVATPLNAFHRLQEGVALFAQGVDPYAGVLFHETPLVLRWFEWLGRKTTAGRVNSFFVLLDVLTAFLIGQIGKKVEFFF